MNGYQLKSRKDGVNHITVLKHLEGNKFESVWKFSLEGDDRPISFLKFITQEQFAVMNWDGWLRIYDLTTRKEVFNENYEGSVTARALCSEDGSRLFIKTGGLVNQLIIMRSDDHSIEKKVALTFAGIGAIKHIQQFGNKLFFYTCEGRSPSFIHGYSIYDLKAEKFASNALPHPQREPNSPACPSIDRAAGIGIMPSWKDPVFRGEGDDQFIAQELMVFDLNEFSIIRTIPVRAFKLNELTDSNPRKNQETLRALSGTMREKSYDKAVRNFMYSLFEISPTGDGQSCWVMWRNGAMRRVWYNGTLSPLYQPDSGPSSIMRFSKEPDGFILHVSKDIKYLLHIEDFEKVGSIEDIEICQLDYSLPEGREMQILNNAEAEEWDSERIYHVVKFAGIRDKDSILDALRQVRKITEKGRAIKKGHLLCFLFKNMSKKTYEEKEFFPIAIKIPGAVDLMLQIAENALSINIDGLYGSNNEDNALFHNFYALLKQDEQHSLLVFRYMDQIDLEHDSGNMEDLRELLIQQLGEDEFAKQIAEWPKLKEEFDSW